MHIKVKTSKLDHPHVKLLIAHLTATGHSQRKIAQGIGTSQPTISRFTKKEDVQKMIQEKEERLCIQVCNTLLNDPRFMAKFQKKIEKLLLDFRGLF
jgi:hypothetical protein